ncbi:MAG: ACT domain-containing protein [Oscillospiraceae bacterium]
MRAIVTVVAKDSVGIIAYISAILADKGVNVMDISQTLMQEYFTMIMLVDLTGAGCEFDELRETLRQKGEERGLIIRIQREDIFNAMFRV